MSELSPSRCPRNLGVRAASRRALPVALGNPACHTCCTDAYLWRQHMLREPPVSLLSLWLHEYSDLKQQQNLCLCALRAEFSFQQAAEQAGQQSSDAGCAKEGPQPQHPGGGASAESLGVKMLSTGDHQSSLCIPHMQCLQPASHTCSLLTTVPQPVRSGYQICPRLSQELQCDQGSFFPLATWL